MQPIIYLLARLTLTWLQYLEKEERAFLHTTQTVLVSGAAHCWAVVYALFVAVMARSARSNQYGGAFIEDMLPWWVLRAERIAALSMISWWFVGCLRLMSHILEDDNKILPVDYRDVGTPTLLRAARSPLTRWFLAGAQAVGLVGLFLSLLLLCVALIVLPGDISACESCLVAVSLSFAVPLTIMALQRAAGVQGLSLGAAAEAAAAETASLGPQFCVILSLMDLRDHSQKWALLFPLTAAVYVAGIIACAHTPPRLSGIAVPPNISELILSGSIDMIAGIVLTLAFAAQTTWGFVATLSALVLLFILVCVALAFKLIREALTELLEPIMPLRSDSSKERHGPIRDLIRMGTRAMVLISGVVALYDVAVHVSRQPASSHVPDYAYDYQNDYSHDHHDDDSHDNYGYGDYDHDWEHGHHHYGDTEPIVLRWLPSDFPGEETLTGAIGEALRVTATLLKVETTIMEHRILLLSITGEMGVPRGKWKDLLEDKPDAKMHSLADTSFPTHLDRAMCDRVMDDEDKSLISEFDDKAVQEAYEAACRAWEQLPKPHHHHHYDYDEDYHDHPYWGDDDHTHGDAAEDDGHDPDSETSGHSDRAEEENVAEGSDVTDTSDSDTSTMEERFQSRSQSDATKRSGENAASLEGATTEDATHDSADDSGSASDGIPIPGEN